MEFVSTYGTSNSVSNGTDDAADFVLCLKPDSKTVLVEVALNGELLAFQEDGKPSVFRGFVSAGLDNYDHFRGAT